MKWLEIAVETEAAAVETVAAIMRERGEGGVAMHQDVVPEDENGAYHYDTSRPTVVTTYVPATREGAARRDAIAAALGHLTAFNLAVIGEPRTREVAEEDWANAWKDFFHPLRFGRRLVVKPSWRDYTAGPNDLIVEIDPGMAFGTGLHQTTAMCLALLEDYVTPGSRVLDQGAGSGILSIAAARLGASAVTAVDVAEVAVEAARANVAANGLADAITVLRSDRVPDTPAERGGGERAAQHAHPSPTGGYDVIVANIIANVIVDLAPRIAGAIAPGGVLIASGIIRDRESDVRDALAAAGLTVERREALDEWVALVARGCAPATKDSSLAL